VTRVLSGAVLLIIAIVVVWFAPAMVFLAVAELLLVLACVEYGSLARAAGFAFPLPVSTAAAALTCASFARLAFGGYPSVPLDAVMISAVVAIGALSLASWRGGADALPSVATALLPMLYLGLPLGSMVSIRETRGPAALFLLMLTVFVSDTAQYYSGRAFGRRPLAPRISPKKTVEGAVGGFIFGAAIMIVVGMWWAPAMAVPLRALLGVTIVALGIAGDLFESMLKRSAGVKDSSHLIPGHGGILDRIDALLFAAPVYYVVVTHVA
jgi:phosphatidate cytidylyltransferase